MNETSSLVDELAEALSQRLNLPASRNTISITFDQLFEKWLHDYAQPYMMPYTVWTFSGCYRNHFQRWHGMRAYDIKRSDVQAWVSDIAEKSGPGAANRARELIRMVYNRAIRMGVAAGQL